MMKREEIMNFFRNASENGLDNILTPDDKREIFLGVLAGPDDVTKSLLDKLLNDYARVNIEIFDKDIENWKVGERKEWNFGLCIREVYRHSENSFLITDTSDGWKEAEVNKERLQRVLDGEISLLSLNWN